MIPLLCCSHPESSIARKRVGVCLRSGARRRRTESIRTGAFMRSAHRRGWAAGAARLFAGAALAALIGTMPAGAQNDWLDGLVAAVVRIKTHINPDGRTVEGLGREREGSAIVIDNDGLVLTIGYLMVEAYAAEVI